jgi:serine/threonine protein kinase/tetratricopeptide (TPR) repeat protein
MSTSDVRLRQQDLTPTGSPISEADSDHRAHRIDCFEIIKELGRGSFGVVYLALEVQPNRQVAIKVPILPRDPIARRELADRFLDEAGKAAAFTHHGIVEIYRVGVTSGSPHWPDGTPFAVMPYLEGGTLQTLLDEYKDRGETLPYRETARILMQVADALHTAHTTGRLIHRDLKPSNILLDSERTPRVADLGLAIHKSQLATGASILAAGTLAYMAPEQLAGSTALDRADIYSFGVILYRMLTGELPFEETPQHLLMVKIMQDNPEPVRQRAPFVPRLLADICEQCLRKDPADRPSTARDLFSSLQKWLADDAIRPEPSGLFVPNWTLAQTPPKQLLWRGNFIGRRAQLADLQARLGPNHIVPIVGPVNSGKSALIAKFFSEPERPTEVAARFIVSSSYPIGLGYIDLAAHSPRSSPVLRGLCVMLGAKLGSMQLLDDPERVDERCQAYLFDELIPERFASLVPLLVFDNADAVLAHPAHRGDLDRVLKLSHFEAGGAIVAIASGSVPDGAGKRRIQAPIVLDAYLTSDEWIEAKALFVDAGADEQVVSEGIAMLGGELALFTPGDVIEAIRTTQRKSESQQFGASDVISALWAASSISKQVSDHLERIGLPQGAVELAELSQRGWLLVLAILARETQLRQSINDVLQPELASLLISNEVLVANSDGTLLLSQTIANVLRLELIGRLAGQQGTVLERLLADGVDRLLLIASRGANSESGPMVGVEEAVAWLERAAPGAVVLRDRLIGFLAIEAVDDVIYPVARDDAVGFAQRSVPISSGDVLQPLLGQLAVATRFEQDTTAMFALLSSAIRVADNADSLSSTEVRLLDIAGYVTARRYRRFSEIVGVREMLVPRLRELLIDETCDDVGLVKWSASWFLNCAWLCVAIGQFPQGRDYLHFAKQAIHQLPSASSLHSMLDSMWLRARCATIEARLAAGSADRRAALRAAADATADGLTTSNGHPTWVRRHLSSVRRLLDEVGERHNRLQITQAAEDRVADSLRQSDDRSWPLAVSTSASALWRFCAEREADSEAQHSAACRALALLRCRQAEVDAALARKDGEAALELGRSLALVSSCKCSSKDLLARKELLTEAQRLLARTVDLAPTAEAWRLYLRVLDLDDPDAAMSEWTSEVMRPRRPIPPALRSAITTYRGWGKARRTAQDGRTELWCFQREWEAAWSFEQIALSQYAVDWERLPPRERQKVVRKYYADRLKRLDWLRREFEPFPQVFVTLAWTECQCQHLLGFRVNGGSGTSDYTAVARIFADADKVLPDNWHIAAARARFLRYVWNHDEAIAMYRNAIAMAPRAGERRRLSIQFAEVILTKIRHLDDSPRSAEDVSLLREAWDCLQGLEAFVGDARSASMLRDRVAFELGYRIDWNELDHAYALVMEGDDYVQSVVKNGPAIRSQSPERAERLAEAVQMHFTDVDILRSFGSLLLRRAERCDNVEESMRYARMAYTSYTACRVLEEAWWKKDKERPTTRFQRARCILVAAERSRRVSPFEIDLEGKPNNLRYAQSLFNGVANRSVGAFSRMASSMTGAAARLENVLT